MKDFDFDEIDRAVSSVNTDKSESSDNSEDTANLAPALAGRRSSGQFMDVVHPSSNMRRASLKMPERASSPSPMPNTSPATSSKISDDKTVDQKPEKTELPTPTIQNNGLSNSKDETEDSDIDKISEDISNELDQKFDELPDTPFISGTKVEKRPLGAFSTGKTPQTNEKDDQDKLDDKKDTSLPDELQDKLLSIESDESKPNPDEQNEVIAAPEKPEVAEKPDIPVVESQPAVATSINQQYKEKPSTGDKASGAIFDTDAYHKPLVSPAKKKFSWMMIVWIVIIIASGVGTGVIVFNYIMPNL